MKMKRRFIKHWLLGYNYHEQLQIRQITTKSIGLLVLIKNIENCQLKKEGK